MTTAYSAKDFQEMLSEGQRKQEQRKSEVAEMLAAYQKKYGQTEVVVLIKRQPEVERRPWYGIVVHPSSKILGYWQWTVFDEDGFSMDQAFKTQNEALLDAWLQGCREPNPELFEEIGETPHFMGMVQWSMLPDDEKWNHANKTQVSEGL